MVTRKNAKQDESRIGSTTEPSEKSYRGVSAKAIAQNKATMATFDKRLDSLPKAPPEPFTPLSMDERPTPKWAQAIIDNLNRNALAGKETP